MPIVDALDGSTALVSVVAILSGIIGVIVGGFLLGPKVLRIRQDDYVTRGITMGINSSAVASVHLLQIDPRASALASLSLFLFGLVEIFLAAVPPVANLLRSWVGL
jgi:putative effector of murein hydrolase